MSFTLEFPLLLRCFRNSYKEAKIGESDRDAQALEKGLGCFLDRDFQEEFGITTEDFEIRVGVSPKEIQDIFFEAIYIEDNQWHQQLIQYDRLNRDDPFFQLRSNPFWPQKLERIKEIFTVNLQQILSWDALPNGSDVVREGPSVSPSRLLSKELRLLSHRPALPGSSIIDHSDGLKTLFSDQEKKRVRFHRVDHFSVTPKSPEQLEPKIRDTQVELYQSGRPIWNSEDQALVKEKFRDRTKNIRNLWENFAFPSRREVYRLIFERVITGSRAELVRRSPDQISPVFSHLFGVALKFHFDAGRITTSVYKEFWYRFRDWSGENKEYIEQEIGKLVDFSARKITACNPDSTIDDLCDSYMEERKKEHKGLIDDAVCKTVQHLLHDRGEEEDILTVFQEKMDDILVKKQKDTEIYQDFRRLLPDWMNLHGPLIQTEIEHLVAAAGAIESPNVLFVRQLIP